MLDLRTPNKERISGNQLILKHILRPNSRLLGHFSKPRPCLLFILFRLIFLCSHSLIHLAEQAYPRFSSHSLRLKFLPTCMHNTMQCCEILSILAMISSCCSAIFAYHVLSNELCRECLLATHINFFLLLCSLPMLYVFLQHSVMHSD